MSTGRSADSPPSRPRLPKPASSAIAVGQLVDVVDDLHRPPAEHVARTHQHGEPDAVDDLQRLLEVGRRAARRLRDVQLVAQGVPLLAVLGEVDRRRRRPGDQLRRDQRRQLQRRLPAERDDDLRRHAAGGGGLGGDDVLRRPRR